ncbi:uncharacterized protein EAE98_007530 [Botrytis deweyae]|uniref:NlpC/P60 domain-containing protein n=1 Tax=Botrytis deweyae TaxID=2478750 RepID=A0ABQ7IGJ6_9HELO|nr:uncharacterized protein EAE98_007530 [Botrytis deweyae]KAF7923712.1 hypothetical protein EAE98_007530 [Botrytis deweyae]
MLSQLQLKPLITFLYFSSSVLAIPVLEEKGTSCTAPEGTGTCQPTSTCTSNGFHISGYCPGPTSTQCCISKTCQPSTGAGGLCLNTAGGCDGGSFIAGFCPGNSAVQCCVKKSDTSDKKDAEKGSASGKDVVQAAVAKEGVKYVFGGGGCKGESNGGFDCSGLTQYAICKAEGYTIPRTAQLQYHSSLGKRIPRAQAKAGDFIFWGTNGDCMNKVHHVGIFMRSNWMVNAPHTGSVVRESTFEGSSELCDYAVRFWKD